MTLQILPVLPALPDRNAYLAWRAAHLQQVLGDLLARPVAVQGDLSLSVGELYGGLPERICRSGLVPALNVLGLNGAAEETRVPLRRALQAPAIPTSDLFRALGLLPEADAPLLRCFMGDCAELVAAFARPLLHDTAWLERTQDLIRRAVLNQEPPRPWTLSTVTLDEELRIAHQQADRLWYDLDLHPTRTLRGYASADVLHDLGQDAHLSLMVFSAALARDPRDWIWQAAHVTGKLLSSAGHSEHEVRDLLGRLLMRYDRPRMDYA